METFFRPSAEVTVTGSEGSTSSAPSLTDTFIGAGCAVSLASAAVSLIDALSIVHAVNVPAASTADNSSAPPHRNGDLNTFTNYLLTLRRRRSLVAVNYRHHTSHRTYGQYETRHNSDTDMNSTLKTARDLAIL